MQYLPTSEEQNWLVSRLGELVASKGHSPFLEMPIVEPTRKFFPDPWTFSHKGLDRLTRRLMQYAGLDDLDVKIGTYVEFDSRSPISTGHGDRSTAGVFMGIEGGRCLFAFNERTPADAEFMAGVMCHEVAHAYRAHHGLVVSTSVQEEECITDVTTAYLGFGILAANNSFRFRTAGWNVGYAAYQMWSAQSTGYLTTQAFAFLLAIQMVARDLSMAERGRLLRHLEADQAAFTKSGLRAVWDRQLDIMKALQIGPGAVAVVPKPLDHVLRPLPAYDGPDPEAVVNRREEPVRFNRGRPVFRVPTNRARMYVPIGLVTGAVLGAIGAAVFQRPEIVAVGVFFGVTAGVVRGYRSGYDVCCDPNCEAILGDADTCPNCGGIIAGTIRHPSDRLEAAEEWERRMKEQQGGKPKARKIRRPANDKGGPAGARPKPDNG